MTNLARFTISGTPSSDAGYDVSVGGAPVLQLEVSSEDVRQVTFQVHSSSDPASPRCSRNAPELTLDNGHGATGANVDAFNPASAVTISAGIPGTVAAHLWEVRCLVNGGTNQNGTPNPDLVFSRFIVMRSVQGLRKLTFSERSEYDPIDAWAGAFNELIDLWSTSGGSTDPTKLPLNQIGMGQATLSAGVATVTTTLQSGAKIFLTVATHSVYEGRHTITNQGTTGFEIHSSDELDDSVVDYLWIKL